jgi:hypothetical protein
MVATSSEIAQRSAMHGPVTCGNVVELMGIEPTTPACKASKGRSQVSVAVCDVCSLSFVGGSV